ncbi:MAG: hypothetical protein UHI81_12740, partial [Olegusella sp.]|nr:hypothetical protein [Olegusella sp.]
MERLFRGVLKHRKTVIGIFIALTIVCGLCIPQVKIDADMSDYLPTSAQSKQDLDFMKDTYGNDITNARVYITGISQVNAAKFEQELEQTAGVTSVTWLGDEVDLAEPLAVQDQDTIS